MALGEVLGEARGKVTVLRALHDGKVEVTLQGSGKLLGSEITDLVTYWTAMRPNGTYYGEGHQVIMSTDGSAEWKGSGVGKPTGRGWRYSYGGAFQNIASQKWGRLLDVYTVGEYDVDENGNYHWKIWEWKY